MNASQSHFILPALYLLIFCVHFVFALWIVLSKKVSIAIQLDAPASPVIQVVNRVLASPTGILVGLTLINLPSVLVFWRFELGFVDRESTIFAVLLSPLTHALWHTVLAIDEWWRAKNVRLRIVFLVNHILWVLLLLRA